MRIWLIRDFEPLPTDPGDRRLMRMGMLAQALARAGHQTRWITSSFDHYQKRQREPGLQEFNAEANLTITVLASLGYRRNISLARIRYNRHFARALRRFASDTSEKPDVIVTDIPATESAAAAVTIGKQHGIPTILSIRDLWPDFFADHLPRVTRPMARLLLFPLERQVRFACANATALVGISRGYLNWGLDKAGRAEVDNDRVFPLGYRPRSLPTKAERATILRQLGVQLDSRLIAFVGSWGRTYDLQLVLETARRLSDREDVQFLVAGAGEQSQALVSRFSELPNVLLPGWIGADEIAIILDQADIGLLPYTANAPQGLPNKVFEYMAYGAYQISTIAGELASFYAETGAGRALARPDAGELARNIADVLVDPAIASARMARVSEFHARWHSDVIYANFAAFIEDLARTHAKSTMIAAPVR